MSKQLVGPDFGNVKSRSSSTAGEDKARAEAYLRERAGPGTQQDERIIARWDEEGDSDEEIAVKWKELQRLRRERANAPPPPPTTIADTVGGWLKTGAGAVADFGKAAVVGAGEAAFGPIDQRIKDLEGDLAGQDAILAEGHEPYLHRPERPEDWLPGLKAKGLRQDIAGLKGTQKEMAGGGMASTAGQVIGKLGMGLVGPGARLAQVASIKGAAPLLPGQNLRNYLRTPPVESGPLRRGVSESAGALLDVGVEATHHPEKTWRELRDEAILGVTMAGPAGAAAAKANSAIRDTRGQIGKYVKALEQGKDFLASPEAQKLDRGIAGIGQLGFDQGERMGQHTAERLQSTMDRITARESAIPDKDIDIDVSPFFSDLDDSVRRFSNQNPHRPDVLLAIEGKGTVENPGIKGNLRREVSTPIRLKPPSRSMAKRGPPGRQTFQGYEAAGKPEVYPYATPADLLAQRRLIRMKSDPGTPQTPENAPYRELYGTVSEATHSPSLPNKVGDQFKEMDAEFSADMEKIGEANELILGGADDPRAITDSVKAARAGAAKLTNALMDTKAGGAAYGVLEKIKKLGPVYADAVRRVEAKIALNATRFGPPKVFSHSGKWYTQWGTQNVDALLAQLVEPVTRMTGLQAGLAGKISPMIRDPLEAWINGKKLQTEEEEQ